MMRRFLIALIALLIPFAIYAQVLVQNDLLPVSFTAGITHYAGFTDYMVSGTIRPADSELLSGPLVFKNIDSSGINYTTGDFYFFLQIFDPHPVAVDIISASPLINETGHQVSYNNTGSNTMSDFSSSDSSITAAAPCNIFSESDSVNLSKPRPYNLRFNFNIPLTSDIGSGPYTGSITLKIYTKD